MFKVGGKWAYSEYFLFPQQSMIGEVILAWLKREIQTTLLESSRVVYSDKQLSKHVFPYTHKSYQEHYSRSFPPLRCWKQTPSEPRWSWWSRVKWCPGSPQLWRAGDELWRTRLLRVHRSGPDARPLECTGGWNHTYWPRLDPWWARTLNKVKKSIFCKYSIFLDLCIHVMFFGLKKKILQHLWLLHFCLKHVSILRYNMLSGSLHIFFGSAEAGSFEWQTAHSLLTLAEGQARCAAQYWIYHT